MGGSASKRAEGRLEGWPMGVFGWVHSAGKREAREGKLENESVWAESPRGPTLIGIN
ncbi:hypothetical protein PanWU01x14_155880 [Parasponia andersonii]|uniref:Uncharacterized protein n=1 Tax=Parasponia andersonii TaxID=3476 RepID=A0A2P5CGD3_PARAD|nr:hypothetical protein PanWU01x14_155880 [Parasponia andersonii]